MEIYYLINLILKLIKNKNKKIKKLQIKYNNKNKKL